MTPGGTARDGDLRHLAAYVLILAGAAWLMAATGFVPGRFVRAAAMLWPLVAVGLGLDLFGARRIPPGVPWSIAALVLIAVIGLFLPGTARTPSPVDSAAVEPSIVVEPIGQANRAQIEVLSDGPALLVRGGAGEGTLLAATALRGASVDVDARGRTVRRLDVALGAPTGRAASGTREPTDRAASAELRLTDRVPLEILVRNAERAATLDLTGLDVASFDYDGGAGPARITLGGVGPERFEATIVGGAGPVDVELPPSTRVTMRLEPGAGGAAVAVGARSDVTLMLRGGEGPIAIDLPEDARTRVLVEDPRDGILSLPDRIRLVRSTAQGESEDIYETPGFREVVPTIDIRVEELGSGPVVIR